MYLKQVAKFAASAVVLFAVLVSIAAPAVPVEAGLERSRLRLAYVSPILYDDNYWEYGAYVEDPTYLSFDNPAEGFPEGFEILNKDVTAARAIVVLEKKAPASVLRGRVRGFLGIYPTSFYKIVNAIISREDVEKLATTPGVVAVLPDVRLDVVFGRNRERARELLERQESGVTQTGSSSGSGPYHYTVNITRAIDVWMKYGIMGENATIAIIDTGVDYGTPALGLGAIARDRDGVPLVFDVSSLGLVLTPIKAEVVEGYITVDPGKLYVFYPPYYVYKWSLGLWISISGCRSAEIYVSWPTGNRWHVGGILTVGTVRFGLMMYYVTTSVGGISTTMRFTVPTIVVDSDGDRRYDTAYLDTTTTLYLLRLALTPAPCSVTIPGAPTSPDYSFADEKPVKYGDEVVARDLTGDRIADFSLGALAGYVYDAAYAIIFDKLGYWRDEVTPLPHGHGYRTDTALLREVWSYEPVAYVWPGLDPHGDYVVIQYDYGNHGTFCATTAAGRDYYADTGYGVRSIAGQAPRAKIASAPALYFGTTITSIYFFTGFDIKTPYGDGSKYLWPALGVNPWIAFEGYSWEWTYTGYRRVDMTSNSYGISGWALWGWASGMDPESAVFDYTTLVSGVPHFIAVGNGGPGWGTIASPASSTLSIGVGAATEFTYRPRYGYTVPGSSRQVISWSNRGPTELGAVKPDLVAVGSFAWAVGRTWEALALRTFDGRRLEGLFSGTSQATPMAAGVGALVVSAYKKVHGVEMQAYLLKTLMMNFAYDMRFDELSQGTGFVDAYGAVTAVLDPSIPRVYSTDILRDLLAELDSSYEAFTHGYRPTGTWYEPKIFIPVVEEGGTAHRTLVVEGTGRFRAYSMRLTRRDAIPLCDLVTTIFEPTVITSCVRESIAFSVTAATLYGHLAIRPEPLLATDFFEIEMVYPFEYFEEGGRTRAFRLLIPTTVIEIAYWIDTNRDGRFAWSETARIYYDIRRANSVRIQIGNLAKQIEEIEYLATKVMGYRLEGMTRALVVRIGVSGATYRGILPIKVRVVRYSAATWEDVRVSPSTATSRGRLTLSVFAVGAQPGFHSGYVVVEEITRGLRYLVPVSYFVPIDLTLHGPTYRLAPRTEGAIYRNTYLRGAFDYTWRYESGDWRVFKVYVPSTTRVLGVRVTWPTHGKPAYASNIDVMVYGPWTYYMVDEETQKVLTQRVMGAQLAAELTRDPRGGGGYNPTRFWDTVGPGTSLIVSPAASGGIYRVVVRNIQFLGAEYEEPFTLELVSVYVRISVPRTIDVSYGARGWIAFYGPDYLWPAELRAPVEAVFKPLGTTEMRYVHDISTLGVTISVGTPETTGTYYRVRAEVRTGPPTSIGHYVVAFEYRARAPVTTVGWIDGGSPRVFFQHFSLPIYFTFRATVM
ncbi:MAG: S8 family serine peptidase [Sulfolobales archaeon]|nr:S8 family serine peptidase [Sulfolobales archaeon]